MTSGEGIAGASLAVGAVGAVGAAGVAGSRVAVSDELLDEITVQGAQRAAGMLWRGCAAGAACGWGRL